MRRGIAELNGQGEVAGGVVILRSGENARTTIAAVKAKLTELKKSLPPGVEVVWAHRAAGAQPGAALLAALPVLAFPDGDYFAWLACESSAAKQLRSVLVDERGANRKWVRAHGYWRRGAVAVHDDFDE